MRHSAQHQLWEKYLKSRGHAFSPGSRRVLQISFCVLIEAIGLKTETDLLMAEPATIQQIRHRPWLKQPRLEYQADFSFGKVIFGPSFLICNMGGPRDPHLLHFNLRCFWNRFSSPKVPTIRIWTKRRSLSACLIFRVLSTTECTAGWFWVSFLGLKQLQKETPWNWNWNCTCYKSIAVCWTESTGCLQLPQRMFIHFSTCHFFASHIRLWRQHPAAVYVAKIRPFPADLTLVDAAVAYLWPKQPPKAEAAKWPKQLQLQ